MRNLLKFEVLGVNLIGGVTKEKPFLLFLKILTYLDIQYIRH